jgi:CBS domain-containing protein
LITRHDVNQLPVLSGGKLTGMISRQDILHYIQLGQELKTGSPKKGISS